MKFMTFPELIQLSQTLSHSSQECSVHTRIEAYSCKLVKKDKKLTRAMEHSFRDLRAEIEQSVGPIPDEDDALFASPFGHLNKPQSRKTLYLLISLLNVAFPDYDFSEAKPDHFCKEVDGSHVLSSLSTTLQSVRTQSGPRLVYAPRSYSAFPPSSPQLLSTMPRLSSSPVASPSPSTVHTSLHQPLSSGIHPMLYQILDKVIGLDHCDVYSYTPDMDSDPHADDTDSDSESSESSPDEEDFDLGINESFPSSSPPKSIYAPYGRWTNDFDDDDVYSGSGTSPESHSRPLLRRSKGGLLWSSHWFFHNRKLKRILFITIWAKKRGAWIGAGEDSFAGWEGGVGAGARALGLSSR